jgi:serine/threonine protein kinase
VSAAGRAAAPARGVVHRDLKPANVLLARDGEDGELLRPMLTDFGIARLADAPGVTRAHEFVGSPSYVAPESAEGRQQTSAVDVYSAGILLFELVTGEPPFRGGSALELLQRHLVEQPKRPEGLPDPLWTVIERCLRKSPDERPSAARLADAVSREFRSAVLTNTNTLLLHRQRSSADQLAVHVGTRPGWEETVHLQDDDSPLGAATASTGAAQLRPVDEPLVHPQTLRSLPRGQAVIAVGHVVWRTLGVMVS